jgi:N-acetyl-gamma-glutamyl-phosphate reductase
MPRGILATITARLAKDISSSSLRELYRDTFMNEEFLSLLPEGMMPRTASVVGSNYVHVQVALDEHSNRVVISVAIDNLGKGAASQAIQNANIMCGLKEDLGLKTYGVGV